MILRRVRPIPALLLLLSALFFLSGTSALVYQVLWLRLLGLVFGVTVYAASTVWAVFMAGLAIGSLLGGRVADRVRRPVVWFGAAEALIAIPALATPAALNLLQGWYATLHPTLDTSLATLTATRLAISFTVLIIPSALMGAVHHRIGNLPMAVHPHARDALVIGLGGGATAGAVSQHTGVSVDIVELSREVAQAAGRFFRGINFDVLRKPNVRLRVDDGRNYLLMTDRRYDVVTADVILPIHAGSGNLYSAEYFSLVRRALKPGGLALQWVAGTDAEYRLIMRTFLSVSRRPPCGPTAA